MLQEVSPGIRLVGGVADAYQTAARAASRSRFPSIGWSQNSAARFPSAEVRGFWSRSNFAWRKPARAYFRYTVPSWRATKDVSIKDDLVEEVGRMIGYGVH